MLYRLRKAEAGRTFLNTIRKVCRSYLFSFFQLIVLFLLRFHTQNFMQQLSLGHRQGYQRFYS